MHRSSWPINNWLSLTNRRLALPKNLRNYNNNTKWSVLWYVGVVKESCGTSGYVIVQVQQLRDQASQQEEAIKVSTLHRQASCDQSSYVSRQRRWDYRNYTNN